MKSSDLTRLYSSSALARLDDVLGGDEADGGVEAVQVQSVVVLHDLQNLRRSVLIRRHQQHQHFVPADVGTANAQISVCESS